jgi:hypothetical protein
MSTSPKKVSYQHTNLQEKQKYHFPSLSNFESSPARFEYDLLIEEFRAARAETDNHMNNQHQVINFSLTILAASVGLIQFMSSTPSLMSIPARSLYLFGSLICSSFALMYFWHDASVAYLAIFMELVLFPRLETITKQASGSSQPIHSWVEFQYKNRIVNKSLIPLEYGITFGRYVTIIFPGPGLIIAYLVTLPPQSAIPLWESLLLIISVLVSITVILASIYAGWLFSRKLPADAWARWTQS